MTSQKIAWHLLWEIHEKKFKGGRKNYISVEQNDTFDITQKQYFRVRNEIFLVQWQRHLEYCFLLPALSVPITVQNSTFPCYLSGKAAGKGCGSKGTKAFLLKTSPAFSRASKIQFSLDITKDLVFFISVSPFSHGKCCLQSIMNPKLHMFKSASFLFAAVGRSSFLIWAFTKTQMNLSRDNELKLDFVLKAKKFLVKRSSWHTWEKS